MTTIRAAFYPRVSSEQQAAAHTIESQISALSERARSDGTPVPRQFVDDGYSGATLIRPALDRLRDLATVGAIDRIYVHSPDRLARNYAYQVLLLDEWRRRGVELMFRYYRCSGSDGYRFGGERICGNAQVQGEFLETAVWREVSDLLTNPDRLERVSRRWQNWRRVRQCRGS